MTKPNIMIPDEAYRELRLHEQDNGRLRAMLERPIHMVLHCPSCGLQHIDKPSDRCVHDACPRATACAPGACEESWDNPPHKTHLCAECGHKWRPCASHPTNGVKVVAPGSSDDPVIPPLPADGLLVRVGSNREITASQHYKSGAIQVTTKLKIARRR